MCPKPTDALITDFTYTPADGGAAAASTSAVSFGGDPATTFSGGEYIYPTEGAYALKSDVTGNNWHITGKVGDYSGANLQFYECTRLDASDYKGISFKISGTVKGGAVTLSVPTLNNSITADWLNSHGATDQTGPGRCVPKSGTNQYDQKTCAVASASIPVTSTPTVQKILWTDFTGGKPEKNVTPSDITGLYFVIPAPANVGTASMTPYDLDLVIDDLKFVE